MATETQTTDLCALHRYESAAAVVEAHWRGVLAEAGLPPDDWRDGGVVGLDADGDEMPEMPVDEMIASVEDMGLWGYYNNDDKSVHVWVSDTAPLDMVVWMLAHELGHWWLEQRPEDRVIQGRDDLPVPDDEDEAGPGAPYLLQAGLVPDLQEEFDAEAFGMIAGQACRWAQALKDGAA